MSASLTYTFFVDGNPYPGGSLPNKFKSYLTDGNGKNLGVVGFISFANEEKNQQHLHVILPKNYPLPSDADKEETARFLLRTLLKFRRRHFDLWQKHVIKGKIDSGSFFAEMEFIIRDWKTYGLLRRRHRKYTQKGVGRIDWQRTLHRVQPIFSHGNPVYYPPIMAVSDATQDELIQRIHAYIVWSILKDWGGLFGVRWEGEAPERPMPDKEMLRILRRELRGCFVEREMELLRAMIGYLEAQDGFGKKNVPQTFLVKFELIWEDICSEILDNQYDILKEYVPHAVYTSQDKPPKKEAVHPPIPDILCQKDNGIYIFDAKYYNEAPPFYCEPCMKQFMYAYLIQTMLKQKKEEQVEENTIIPTKIAANVFLLPNGNGEEVVHVGDISLADAEGNALTELEKVHVLHVPIQEMMKEYVAGTSSMKGKIYGVIDIHCSLHRQLNY